MASASTYQNLTDTVLCGICYEEYLDRNPRSLQCLHTFCEQCLQGKLDSTKRKLSNYDNSIKCPICSATTKIPDGLVAKLPTFFYSRKINDVRKLVENKNTTCQMCQSGTRQAEVCHYCIECFCGMCEACLAMHDKLHKEHKSIRVDTSKVKHLLCPQHDIHVQYFCITCCGAICNRCYIRTHNEHKVYDLTYGDGKPSGNLRDFLSSELKSTDDVVKQLDELQDEVDGEIRKTETELKNERDDLMKQINDHYGALFDISTQRQEMFHRKVAEARRQLKESQLFISRMINETGSLCEPVTGIPQARIENLEEVRRELEQQMTRSRSVTIEKPKPLKHIPGSRVIQFGECSEGGELSENTDIEPNLICQMKVSPITDVKYLKNSELVITSFSGVAVYSEEGKQMFHHLTQVCNGSLRGVCVNKSLCKIAVTQWKDHDTTGCLNVYTKDVDVWQHDSFDVCQKPLSIAMTKSGDFIVTSIDGSMYKYNKGGEQVWKVDMSDMPRSLAVDSEDRILVCLNKDVLICDRNGKELYSLRRKHRPLSPWDVCPDSNDDILLSDWESKSILRYSRLGDFIRKVITLDYDPNRITLNENKHLAVSEFGTNKLFVYKI